MAKLGSVYLRYLDTGLTECIRGLRLIYEVIPETTTFKRNA